MGVREAPAEPITKTLVGALRDKQMLLVLDNCEHVLETAARLVATLETCDAGLIGLASPRQD